jgi:DNA-binding NtrC family response regulator
MLVQPGSQCARFLLVSPLMFTKILVAVHEQRLRESVRRALETIGYDVVSTGTGRQVLALLVTEAVQSVPINGVLLDLEIADLDAMTTLQEIRDRHEDIPVIIIAGVTDDDHATQAVQAGAAAVIRKPIDPETLRQTCARVFFRKGT